MSSVLEVAAPVLDPPDRDAEPVPVVGTAARRSRTVVVLAAGSLLAVLVAALAVGGGAPAPATPGLPDAGAVVGWGQPVVQLLTRLLAVLVVGSLLVAAALVPAPGGTLPAGARRAVRTAAAGAAGWAACEAVGLLLLTGSVLGLPVARLAPADVVAVATALPAGRTVPAVLLLLATVAVTGSRVRRVTPARALLLLALAAVVLPVVTSGHPAAAGDHLVTVATLAVHVVAASLWVGGLVGVLLHLRSAGALRAVAVHRLSRLSLVCVAAVTLTGVVGALLVTDVALPALLVSGYGALLLAKTLGVLLLVAAGWAHRRRTLPQLRAGRPGAFVRLAVVETALMAGVLAVAVGLSAAPPPEAAAAASSPAAAPSSPAATPVDASAVPPPAAAPDAASPDTAPDAAAPGTEVAPAAPAEDMSGHDHGPLQVSVLVDDDRLHLGAPVQAGVPVTVYNTGADPVVLRADDGSFDAVVPSRTFITFLAPEEPGAFAFGDPDAERYRDVLQVLPAQG